MRNRVIFALLILVSLLSADILNVSKLCRFGDFVDIGDFSRQQIGLDSWQSDIDNLVRSTDILNVIISNQVKILEIYSGEIICTDKYDVDYTLLLPKKVYSSKEQVFNIGDNIWISNLFNVLLYADTSPEIIYSEPDIEEVFVCFNNCILEDNSVKILWEYNYSEKIDKFVVYRDNESYAESIGKLDVKDFEFWKNAGSYLNNAKLKRSNTYSYAVATFDDYGNKIVQTDSIFVEISADGLLHMIKQREQSKVNDVTLSAPDVLKLAILPPTLKRGEIAIKWEYSNIGSIKGFQVYRNGNLYASSESTENTNDFMFNDNSGSYLNNRLDSVMVYNFFVTVTDNGGNIITKSDTFSIYVDEFRNCFQIESIKFLLTKNEIDKRLGKVTGYESTFNELSERSAVINKDVDIEFTDKGCTALANVIYVDSNIILQFPFMNEWIAGMNLYQLFRKINEKDLCRLLVLFNDNNGKADAPINETSILKNKELKLFIPKSINIPEE